jgi:ABC-2 type transport system permease protein
MKTIGIASSKPKLSPEEMMQLLKAGMEQPGDEYGQLRNALRSAYKIVDVDLSSGAPPLDVDVLLVMKPREWTQKHELAFDQFLMFGGKAIVCVDQAELPPKPKSLSLAPFTVKADELLARYGVTVRKELVMDERNVPYPLPRWKDLGGLRMQVYEQVPYPWFLDLRGDSIDGANPAVTGIEAVELLWASPLSIDESKQKGARFARLLTSSEKAWASRELRDVEPKERLLDYRMPEKTERLVLAVAIDGKLESALRDRPELVTATAGFEPVLESPEGTRLVVIGDADFASDIAASAARSWKGNVQLVQNLIDWSLADRVPPGVDVLILPTSNICCTTPSLAP